jgi:hypothetical protein
VLTAYSVNRPDGVTTALGIHFLVYCAVGACFAFSLYALLQPSSISDSGSAMYKPLPATVVTHEPPRTTDAALPIASGVPTAPESRTTGLSAPQLESAPQPELTPAPELAPRPELHPTVTAPSQPRSGRRLNRDVKIESSKRRSGPCIPGYDASGAQTRPCG